MPRRPAEKRISSIFSISRRRRLDTLFHADRRAATADIAGGFFQILEMQHFNTFVAAGTGEFFEIELLVAGDDANDGAGFVANGDEGFEHLIGRALELGGSVHGVEGVFFPGVVVNVVWHFRALDMRMALVFFFLYPCSFARPPQETAQVLPTLPRRRRKPLRCKIRWLRSG